jgi:hypothetical protein
MRKYEEIKVEDLGKTWGERHTHPCFAQLSFSRRSSSGPTELYGSSIGHRDTIMMRVSHSEMDRNLNKDWYHDTKPIVEVEMSLSQFAEAITSHNMGGGVPCTLRFSEKDGEIPYCSFESKRDVFKREFDDHLNDAMSDTKELITKLTTLFNEKKTLNKGDKEEVVSTLERIAMTIGCNAEFVSKSFEEQMDKSIKEAKGEIEAFAQARVASIANQAIAAQGGIGADAPTVSLLEDTETNS